MTWLCRLRLWAGGDRIRASPLDGKLLRLNVGACVRVGELLGQVTARADRAPTECDGAEVNYTCRTATGHFTLRVRATAAGAERVELLESARGEGGERRGLDPANVETFG